MQIAVDSGVVDFGDGPIAKPSQTAEDDVKSHMEDLLRKIGE